MTAIAGRRIDATVNHMPRKVVPAMGHATVIFGLIFDGGLQLDADPVAIAAITLSMTGGTDGTESAGHRTMVFPKIHAVVEFFIGNFGFLRIMAIRAKTQIFSLFLRVPGGRRITALHSGTGSHQHHQPHAYYESP